MRMSSVDRWAQRCRAVGPLQTAVGAQGGHTYRARNATASSPREQGQGDVEGTTVLSRRCGPTESGVRCSGPARAGLTLRESASPGSGTEVSPSHLLRGLEHSFRAGRGLGSCPSQGPGHCRPEPLTHTRQQHHSEEVAAQPCRGALVWVQACEDHVS